LLPGHLKYLLNGADPRAATSIIGSKLRLNCAPPERATATRESPALKRAAPVPKPPRARHLAPESKKLKGFIYMPEKRTIERARRDAREGKSPGTQQAEFQFLPSCRRIQGNGDIDQAETDGTFPDRTHHKSS
jgi:hypothetical protein